MAHGWGYHITCGRLVQAWSKWEYCLGLVAYLGKGKQVTVWGTKENPHGLQRNCGRMHRRQSRGGGGGTNQRGVGVGHRGGRGRGRGKGRERWSGGLVSVCTWSGWAPGIGFTTRHHNKKSGDASPVQCNNAPTDVRVSMQIVWCVTTVVRRTRPLSLAKAKGAEPIGTDTEAWSGRRTRNRPKKKEEEKSNVATATARLFAPPL